MKTKICPQCGLMICSKEEEWPQATCGDCGWFSSHDEICRKSQGYLLTQKSYQDACPNFELRKILPEATDET